MLDRIMYQQNIYKKCKYGRTMNTILKLLSLKQPLTDSHAIKINQSKSKHQSTVTFPDIE